jgi:hypothetical protein
MTDTLTPSALAETIDIIEEAYEFMLAYAAQGLRDESDSSGPSIRDFITRASESVGGLADSARQLLGASASDFVELLARDAKAAQAALGLVLSCRSINSQLVDNLNGSIHLRTLLTDMFLIDEALKSR